MPAQENVVRNEAESAPQAVVNARLCGLLDNPIWSALTTEHAHLALGGEEARRYPRDIGPLSGMPTQSEAGYEALGPLAGPGGTVGLFFREGPRPPAGWTLVRGGKLHQMIASRPLLSTDADADTVVRPLTPWEAPAMVALAELTKPGPFDRRTIELGSFLGVFEAGCLVAMAGTRLHVPGATEVSAVCTHPDARGRGYARLLMSRVIEEIVRAGRLAFLHTLADNHNAIRLYESLGFTVRQSFELAVVRRED